MGITRISILRPLFITMVFCAIVVLGVISYGRLGVDLFPSVNVPVISVFVAYPGANPESIESLVTKPIEDSLAGLSDIEYMRSISSEGQSTVLLAFNDRTNPDSAAIDVERKINGIRSRLPGDTLPPNIVKADVNSLPVIDISFSGNLSNEELVRLVNDLVVPRMQSVPGVAAVDVIGGKEPEIRVTVDQQKLQAHRLSILQVVAALQQDNLNVPSGSLIEAGKEFGVRVNTLVPAPGFLENIVIASTPTGSVRLRDVAKVEETLKRRVHINRTNLTDSIAIEITKQATANTLQVTDEIKAEIDQLQAELPAGVQMDIVVDASVFTRQSLNDVQNTMIEAIILTGLVLLLFLHAWRSTVIVLLAIPTSLIATFAAMFFFGFTLNIMSMMGLTLVVGILVDDSIVILENITRHLKLGETPFTAALKGRAEIGLAAIAITLVDVAVFAPVAFMSGIVGQYFRQFGIVVATAALFSLFVSFTLTPMLASRWLSGDEKKGNSILGKIGRAWDRGFEKLKSAYVKVLTWSLRWRLIVVLLGIVSFASGIGMVVFGLVSTELLPQADQNEFTIIAEMPAGTTLSETDRAVARLEEELAGWPAIDTIFTFVGTSGTASVADSRFARITVKLAPRDRRNQSAMELADRVRRLEGSTPGLQYRVELPNVAGPSGPPIQIRVRGDHPSVLVELARRVQGIVNDTRGAIDVRNSGEIGDPELEIVLDRSQVADLGLSPAQVASAVRTSLAGTVATQFRPANDSEVDVRVTAFGEDTASIEAIKSIPLASATGEVIRLDQIASVRQKSGPSRIERYDRQHVITVSADTSGRAQGDVAGDIQRELDRLSLPPGYSITFGGSTQAQEESFTQLFQALALAVILIYMLLVALYESFLYPFVIILSLPLAVVGAIGGLIVTGHTLNMMSMIGMILLTGLVGKNAILLVDYTNNLRRNGRSRDEALLEAGPARLRPILMTTVTMIAALTPTALAIGEGSELRAPLAIVVIGGLTTSTLLTLVLIPAVFTLIDDLQRFILIRVLGKKEGANLLPSLHSLEPVVVPASDAVDQAGPGR